MKNMILLFFMLVLPILISAQELTPTAVSSSGGYSEGSLCSLSWTLGEVATKTLSTGYGTLIQGFQQPVYRITSNLGNAEFKAEVKVYPVPVADYLAVEFSEAQHEVRLVVINLQGEEVLMKKAESNIVSINMSKLPPSEYQLNIVNKENQLLKSFNIVKY